MLTYKNQTFVCHLDLGIDILRKKWIGVILCHLSEEPIRFLELQRRVKGISQKILTQQLKVLEQEDIVAKKIYSQIPPKVEYYLTPKGLKLLPALTLIEDWAKEYYN